MKRTVILVSSLILAVCLSACGGGSSSQAGQPAAASASSTAQSTPAADASGAAEADLSNPSIVIEMGDIDGITDLGKKMQNFEVPEGTVIKITGLFVKNTSTPSIMEANEAGDAKQGISIYLDEGIEEPADETAVEAVGVAVKGSYFMEFHVSADGFKVL